MSETVTLELELVEAQLDKTIKQAELEPSSAQELLGTFRPYFAKAQTIIAEAEMLVVTDATQVSEIKQARSIRLALRALRIEADKSRKDLKEDSLRRGKAIQGVYNIFEYAVAPVENRMKEMEEFAERAEATRKAVLKQLREEKLTSYGVDTSFYDLGSMPEVAFAQLLDTTRMAHDAKVAEAAKAKEAELAQQKALEVERERIRKENERLKAEAAAHEATIRIERERAAKENAALEAKANAERAARQKLESEKESARLAEEKRLSDEAKAAKLAAAAPDRNKLKAFSQTVFQLSVPEMATKEGASAADKISSLIYDLVERIEALADDLS